MPRADVVSGHLGSSSRTYHGDSNPSADGASAANATIRAPVFTFTSRCASTRNTPPSPDRAISPRALSNSRLDWSKSAATTYPSASGGKSVASRAIDSPAVSVDLE